MTLSIDTGLKQRKGWFDWVGSVIPGTAKPIQAPAPRRMDNVDLLDRYRQALELMPGIFMMVNWLDKRVVFANQEALTFYGFLPEAGERSPQYSGIDFSLIEAAIHPDDQERYKRGRHILPSVPLGETVEVEVRCRNYQDQWCWLHFMARVISRTPEAFPEMVLWYAQDVTGKKNIKDRLVYASYHDPLTGAYNRAYFEEELNKLEGSRNFPLAILMVDIDNMKQINDNLGHSAGDELICRTARVLRAVYRHEDVIARIGGDEFVALLPRTGKVMAMRSLERVRQELNRVNAMPGRSRLCLSMGIAVAKYGCDLRQVLRQADEAMYREKARQRGREQSRPSLVAVGSVNP